MDKNKEVGIFISGLMTGIVTFIVVLGLVTALDVRFHKVSSMPDSKCTPGTSVLYTSVNPSQYFTCETSWVRH